MIRERTEKLQRQSRCEERCSEIISFYSTQQQPLSSLLIKCIIIIVFFFLFFYVGSFITYRYGNVANKLPANCVIEWRNRILNPFPFIVSALSIRRKLLYKQQKSMKDRPTLAYTHTHTLSLGKNDPITSLLEEHSFKFSPSLSRLFVLSECGAAITRLSRGTPRL